MEQKIETIDDIMPGMLPGSLFPRLIDMGELKIEPFSDSCLGNICYYLHFNNKFMKPRPIEMIDLASKESVNAAYEPSVEMDECIIDPGKSVIAQTYEKLGVSQNLIAKLENVTTLGRVMLNHASHGFLHPGHGINEPFRLMIELTNLNESPIKIYATKIQGNEILGTEAFRMYVEKLPYPAKEYKSISKNPRLRMGAGDKS